MRKDLAYACAGAIFLTGLDRRKGESTHVWSSEAVWCAAGVGGLPAAGRIACLCIDSDFNGQQVWAQGAYVQASGRTLGNHERPRNYSLADGVALSLQSCTAAGCIGRDVASYVVLRVPQMCDCLVPRRSACRTTARGTFVTSTGNSFGAAQSSAVVAAARCSQCPGLSAGHCGDISLPGAA